jgi:hypothetical protein
VPVTEHLGQLGHHALQDSLQITRRVNGLGHALHGKQFIASALLHGPGLHDALALQRQTQEFGQARGGRQIVARQVRAGEHEHAGGRVAVVERRKQRVITGAQRRS